MSSHVAVVGASLAGLRAAEQLRAAGHTGQITVYGEEPHPPYNRPPLSKELLSCDSADDAKALHARVAFRRRASVADVDFRLGTRVEQADLGSGTLHLADGSGASFDGLVAATGLRPRRLAAPGPRAGRHVLRTLEHCVALRDELTPGASVVVVGGGFIGCEVAATALGRGCSVTVVEPTGAPMNRVLGPALAAAVQRHHEQAGIRFVTGPSVAAFDGRERVTGVHLTDGSALGADVVVESVGSVCNTEWLAGNPGIDRTDGVLTDNSLAVAGAERAVAVGDLARFPNPFFDDVPRRVEHWSIPTDTARRAATTLVAELVGEAPDAQPFAPIPSFWSDQLDLRLQSFGSPALADEVVVDEGDLDDLGHGLLATYHRDGRHVGSVAVNLPPARQRALREAFLTLPSPA